MPGELQPGGRSRAKIASRVDASPVVLYALDGTVLFGTPAAAGDTMSNPTAPQVLGHMMVFDGTNWVRIRQIGTGGVPVTGTLGTVPLQWNGTDLRQQNSASNSNNGDGSNGAGFSNSQPSLYDGSSAYNRWRSFGTTASSAFKARVGAEGLDVTLRASAVAGEASGQSTAVDGMGWVKRFHAVVDVTAVPTGGTPTLDVYIQTQLSDGTWQDVAHTAQVAGSAIKQLVAWEGPVSLIGTGAEGAAITVDRFFANEDAALAASTVRILPLGDSLRVKWVFSAGGSTGDYTFSVTICGHSD